MSLTDVAQKKVLDWLDKLNSFLDIDDLLRFGSRSRDFIAIGEIFSEDVEWSQELVSAGVTLSYIGLIILREFDEYEENRKIEIKKIINKYLGEAREAVNKKDWLTFHKSIRYMLYEIIRNN